MDNGATMDNKLIANTEKERFLKKLGELQEKHRTAKQATQIQNRKSEFLNIFYVLAYKFEGLSKNQVDSLEKREKELLAEKIYDRSKFWSIIQIIFVISNPVGLITMAIDLVNLHTRNNSYDEFLLYSFWYRIHTKKLKSIYGKDNYYFPN
ncbi:MAG: hypothetical protein HYT61_02245 [Candidatus Yanofskybacteria bacterium]|nr:hypothetical protein [Candidatus Yanofskybacteria bacterium]